MVFSLYSTQPDGQYKALPVDDCKKVYTKPTLLKRKCLLLQRPRNPNRRKICKGQGPRPKPSPNNRRTQPKSKTILHAASGKTIEPINSVPQVVAASADVSTKVIVSTPTSTRRRSSHVRKLDFGNQQPSITESTEVEVRSTTKFIAKFYILLLCNYNAFFYSFQQQQSMPMLTIPTTPEIRRIDSNSPYLLSLIESFQGLQSGVSPILSFPSTPSIASETLSNLFSPKVLQAGVQSVSFHPKHPGVNNYI